MTSLVENDPLKSFWDLSPFLVFVIVAFAGPGVVYSIELARSVFDRQRRAPWGLAIFRWPTVWFGDLIWISMTVAVVAEYYHRAQVDRTFLTDTEFFILCIPVGIISAVLFLVLEETRGDYPAGEKVNANRAYHFVYFAWIAYMLFAAATRGLYYLLTDREEPVLVVLALLSFFGGYGSSIFLAETNRNPFWKWVVRRYPSRTWIP